MKYVLEDGTEFNNYENAKAAEDKMTRYKAELNWFKKNQPNFAHLDNNKAAEKFMNLFQTDYNCPFKFKEVLPAQD